MRFEDLVQVIERDMRMSHVYQPVMLRELLDRGGHASRKDIARALLTRIAANWTTTLKSPGTWLDGCLQIGRS
jgi:hypothetical protein